MNNMHLEVTPRVGDTLMFDGSDLPAEAQIKAMEAVGVTQAEECLIMAPIDRIGPEHVYVRASTEGDEIAFAINTLLDSKQGYNEIGQRSYMTQKCLDQQNAAHVARLRQWKAENDARTASAVFGMSRPSMIFPDGSYMIHDVERGLLKLMVKNKFSIRWSFGVPTLYMNDTEIQGKLLVAYLNLWRVRETEQVIQGERVRSRRKESPYVIETQQTVEDEFIFSLITLTEQGLAETKVV